MNIGLPRDPQRACPSCGLLVLTPYDDICPYCEHRRGAWVLPAGLRESARDWRGSMLRLQADPEGSRFVFVVVFAVSALALVQVVPWASLWLVDLGLLAGALAASAGLGRVVLAALPRLPSPWPVLRVLPAFQGLRGPEAARSLEEHRARVQTDLHLLDARISEIERVRGQLEAYRPGAQGPARERVDAGMAHLDVALARLEDMKTLIEVGGARLDRALWRLRLRGIRGLAFKGASSGMRAALGELSALLQEGERARALIKVRLLDMLPEGEALLEQWERLETEVSASARLLTEAEERSLHERASRALSLAAKSETSQLLLDVPGRSELDEPPALPDMVQVEDALRAVEAQATELEIQLSAAEELHTWLIQR